MTYERFEDLPVWKDAADLAVSIFRWSYNPIFHGKGDISNQIQRAVLSISNNIAEGFERGTTKELLTFLYYSRGSAGEVRSILAVMEKMDEFDNFKSEISNLKSRAESVSRQLRAWAESLQSSDISGQRYLTENQRNLYKSNKRAEKFVESISVKKDIGSFFKNTCKTSGDNEGSKI